MRRAPSRRAKFPPQPAQPRPGRANKPRARLAPPRPPEAWDPAVLRPLVIERAEYRCDRCALYLPGKPYSLQHRCARGMGGRRGLVLDTPANLVVLCGNATTPGGCHNLIENTAARRTAGYDHGFAIKGEIAQPEDVPIFRHLREWVIPSHQDGMGLWIPAEPLLPATA